MARAGRAASLPGTERLPRFVTDASGLHGDLLTLSHPSCLTLYDTLNHGAEKHAL